MKVQKIIRNFPDYNQPRFSILWGVLGFLAMTLAVEVLLLGVADFMAVLSDGNSLFR